MIEVINLNYDDFRSNSYLVKKDEKTYLIDPSVELRVLKKYQLSLDGILITHAHIDHILNLKEIYDFYHCPVYCHSKAIEKIEDNDKNCARIFGFEKNLKIDNYHIVHEGDLIEGLFKVLETPGHTDCSVCYLIHDDKDAICFSGDTLFYQSVGRTDLYSGNSASLIKSLKKLTSLKSDYVVYPGHEQGTTLEEEKEYNSFIKRYCQ